MPPLVVPFHSAKTNQEGNQIILIWQLTSSSLPTMEAIKYFEWMGGNDASASFVIAGTTGPGESGIVTATLSDAAVSARGGISGTTLTITGAIDIGSQLRFQRGEIPAIETAAGVEPENLFISGGVDGSGDPLVATGKIDDPEDINTSGIGIIPATGASGSCYQWAEARFDLVQGSTGDANIATIRDSSERNNSLTQSTSANQAFLEDDGQYPVYIFGTSDFYQGADWFHCQNFLIAFAVKFTDVSSVQTLLSKTSANNLELKIETDGNDTTKQLLLFLSTNGTSWSSGIPIGTITPGTTQLFIVAKNGSTIDTCVDGLWSSTTFSGTVFNGTARFTFGASSGGLVNAEFAFWAVYDSALTEPQRAVLVHAMRNRTTIMSTDPLVNGNQTIILSGGTLPDALPAWATSEPRRPIAVVNMFGGNYTNATQNNYDNLTGQNKNWFDWTGIFDDPPTEDDLKDWLRGEIDDILHACADFEILFNVPGGRLQDDIFSSYQVSYNTQKQLDALSDIITEYNLGDGTNGTRRAWFYVGIWPCITEGSYVYDNTAILAARNGGRMNSRTVAFTKPGELKTNFLDYWPATYNDIKCLLCDAAIRNERKFIQLAHDSAVVSAGLRLVGESISYPDIHRAPWFALLHIPKGAPWWNLDGSGVPQRSLGYRATWRVDPTESRIYFGTQDVADYFNSTPNGENDAGFNNMRVEQVVEFIAKGALPVAYSRKAVDVGLAWNFVHGYSTVALVKTIQRRRRAARIAMIQRSM